MVHNLLVTKPIKPPVTVRPTLYSLYRRELNGRYTRIAENSYYYSVACVVFHDRVTEAFSRGTYVDIRPI